MVDQEVRQVQVQCKNSPALCCHIEGTTKGEIHPCLDLMTFVVVVLLEVQEVLEVLWVLEVQEVLEVLKVLWVLEVLCNPLK